MPVATVTAKYVNPPKAGQKNGSIKGEDGTLYIVNPKMLSQMQQGGMYKLEWLDNDFKGNTYHIVQSVEAVAQAKATAAQDATSERIFVCGALNAALSNPNVTPLGTDIEGFVRTLRAVWDATFGAPPEAPKKKTTAEELNDEIPF